MDDLQFDAFSQTVARWIERLALVEIPSGPVARRRLVLGGIAGASLRALLGAGEGDAKRKRRKKKKRKKPAPQRPCDPPCPDPLLCKDGGCACPGGREACGANCCAANERCHAGECRPTQCPGPCPGEKVCQDGACVCPDDRNECRDDVCCPKGEICSAGQCAACQPASCDGATCGTVDNACGDTTVCGRCGQDQVCLHGQCVAQCPPEHRICDGECFPEAFCCSDAECAGNLRCIGGTCGCPDGRVECNGRCCGDREDCIDGVCQRFECEKEFPGLLAYCGPYPYNCCPAENMQCCNRVHGMINVCCLRETAICCAAPGGCCDRD